MKALTIRQPWASLIIDGHKDVENRTWWQDKHRGPLVIHAGKGMTQDEYQQAAIFCRRRNLPEPGPMAGLPRGVILGVADLHEVTKHTRSKWHVRGQYGWYLRDPQRLKAPIEARGHQGLWNVDLVDAARIRLALSLNHVIA